MHRAHQEHRLGVRCVPRHADRLIRRVAPATKRRLWVIVATGAVTALTPAGGGVAQVPAPSGCPPPQNRIVGTQGNDLRGGTGDGDDILDGGSGNDRVNGEAGDDNVFGGDGGDHVAGGAGSDKLSLGDGPDTGSGGTGDDKLFGGPEDDRVDGGAGNDRVRGDDGDDTVRGGPGNDRVVGGAGSTGSSAERGTTSWTLATASPTGWIAVPARLRAARPLRPDRARLRA